VGRWSLVIGCNFCQCNFCGIMHSTLVFILLMLVGGVIGVHTLVAKGDVDKDMGSVFLCVFRIKGQGDF